MFWLRVLQMVMMESRNFIFWSSCYQPGKVQMDRTNKIREEKRLGRAQHSPWHLVSMG